MCFYNEMIMRRYDIILIENDDEATICRLSFSCCFCISSSQDPVTFTHPDYSDCTDGCLWGPGVFVWGLAAEKDEEALPKKPGGDIIEENYLVDKTVPNFNYWGNHHCLGQKTKPLKRMHWIRNFYFLI